ncbi:hypothetical protein N0V88_007257 [Collariella sp. IMI 366227]|nr:hypothetical protein N0V88_007257 [Collariella sp. IMI 366227]
MPKTKETRPRPQAYEDGLMPVTFDTCQSYSYPEVVSNNYDKTKNERSYPEVARVVPVYAGALPRNSGLDSLGQVWSNVEDGNGEEDGKDEERTPPWKRPIVWVVVIALGIIIALAGLLGVWRRGIQDGLG